MSLSIFRGIFLFAVLASTPLLADEVYRCVQADGSLSFQQTACAGGGEKIETGEVQVTWDGLRKGERQLFQAYLAEDEKRYRRKIKQWERERKQKQKAADTRRCWNKRKQLQRVKSRLHTGYQASQGAKLRRQRDDLQDYLRRFCPAV